MSRSGRLVVVGGGVVGAACAYFTARSGWQVTLIDQGTFGGGCSHGNCGYVCPSHLLPLAAPGATWPAVKALLQPNSPFKIRPRFDPALWTWLWRFARRCNARQMMETARALQPLLDESRELFGELVRGPLTDCEWEERGLLFVFQTAAGFEHYAATDELLREHFQLGATRYDSEALTRLEPALKAGLGGAWHYEHDAHLRPDKLMSAWRRALEGLGVTIRERCEFREFTRRDSIVTGVETSDGKLSADAVVVATGAWTPRLQQQLGRSIPIQPGKGYSITMPRPVRAPTIPMIFEEHRVAVTPMQSGYRIGSTMEFAGYDASLNPRRLQLLRDGAKHYLHEPWAEPVIEQWSGWRPMTPDGKPYIGQVPGCDNVFVAAGHGMLGVSMAPSTGKLIAELLSGESPHVDPQPYSFDRRDPGQG